MEFYVKGYSHSRAYECFAEHSDTYVRGQKSWDWSAASKERLSAKAHLGFDFKRKEMHRQTVYAMRNIKAHSKI
jgi:hypothetical protein